MALLGAHNSNSYFLFSDQIQGEMHFIPSHANSWFNLPRGGNVGFAAQDAWVQSATIRENILLGSPYDEERYKKGNVNNSPLDPQ